MSMTMSLPGIGDVAITADGVSDFASGDTRMTMDMGSLFDKLSMAAPSGAPSDVTVEMRVVDGTIYIHYPEALAQFMGGAPWLRVDGGAQLQQLGSSGLGPFGQADPRQYLEYLATVSSGVEKVGSETVGDVETTKYHAVVQFDKALEQVPDATLDQLGIDKRAFTEQLDAMRGVVGSEMPVDVWIDHDGLLRRMRIDMSVASEKIAIEMNLDQYGVAVDVAAPPTDQVRDLGSVLGNLSNRGSGTGSGTA
jgi:hypothetical protein